MQSDTTNYCKDYLVKSPLLLAQLYERLHHRSANPNDYHDNGFYLFEALIKLAAITLLAQYRADVEQSGQRNTKLDGIISQLERPSLGQWLQVLRDLAGHFATATQANGEAHDLARMKQQLERKHTHDDSPALLALYCRIKNGVDNPPAQNTSYTLIELFNRLVKYRNNVIGHGANRVSGFYADISQYFLAASNEILNEDLFTPFGVRGAYLIYLQRLEIISNTHVKITYRPLRGQTSEAPVTVELDKTTADGLLPETVAIHFPKRNQPLPLTPLVLYQDNGYIQHLLLPNSNHKDKNIEYLNYQTGNPSREPRMLNAMLELLTLLTGQTLNITAVDEPQALQHNDVNVEQSRLEDFELLAEIAGSGRGQVYKARQLPLDRLVTLKVLPDEQADNTVAMARFQQEINTLSQSDHPNIVKVYTQGRLPLGGIFYAMEYLEGVDLAKVWSELAHIKNTEQHTKVSDRTLQSASQTDTSKSAGDSSANFILPKLPPTPLPKLPDAKHDRANYIRHIVSLIRDVARALQSLHQRKIIHRDVKPSNLLLSADGKRLVLTNFGLVKRLDVSRGLSTTEESFRTSRYTAPEQLAEAAIKISPAVDVRGLGVVLWEMLTLRQLFGDVDEQQAAIAVLNSDLPLLRSIDPSFDKDLEAIVTRATERRCEERIQTAEQLADYLDLYLDGKPLPIRPWTFTEKMIRVGRNHPVKAGLAASVAVALLGAGAYGIYWDDQQNKYVRPHETYYSDVTFRNGMFEGINPVSAEIRAKRHGLWRFTTQGSQGNITEIAAVDKNGQCPSLSLYSPIFDIMRINNFSQKNAWGLSEQEARICRIAFDNQLKFYTAYDKNDKFIYELDYRHLAMSNNKSIGYGCFENEGGIRQSRSSAGADCLRITYNDSDEFSGFPKVVDYTHDKVEQAIDADGIIRKQVDFDEIGRVQKVVGVLSQEAVAANNEDKTNTKSNPTIELTYDKSGNIIKSHNKGYLIQSTAEIQLEYDDYGNRTKISYYDRDGRPINNKDGVHQIIIKYDDAGNVLELKQTDTLNKLVADNIDGVAKIVVEYNQLGKRVKLETYDSAQKLVINKNGFSRKEFIYSDDGILSEEWLYGLKDIPQGETSYANIKYNKKGFVTEAAFYDSNKNLISGKDGHVKVQFTYDEKSNQKIAERFYGTDGKLSNDPKGYAIVHFTYNEDFSLLTKEEYFDADEKPIINKQGYQTVKHHYDNKKRKIKQENFDSSGKPILNTSGFYSMKKKYEDHTKGRDEEEKFYDANDNLVNHAGGYAILKIRYNLKNEAIYGEFRDKDGNLVIGPLGYAINEVKHNQFNSSLRDSIAYYGVDRELMVWDEAGYAKMEVKFNNMGFPIETKYYGADGKLIIEPSAGWAMVINERDERGNKTLNKYFNEKEQPIIPPALDHAEYRAKYDEFDNLTEYSILDDKGNLIPDNNGCGISKFIYDSNRKQEHQCFGIDGKLGSSKTIPAITRYEYDGLGNQTKESYYDINNQRVISKRSGCARLEWSYDRVTGNKETESCYGLKDELNPGKDGVMKTRYVYDQYGNNTEEHYLDQNNNLVNTPDGDAKVIVSYDEYNNPIKWEHFDSENKRVLFQNQYSIQENTYDSDGYAKTLKYFGTDEKPIFVKESGYAKADTQNCRFFDADDNPIESNFAVTVKKAIQSEMGWYLGIKEGDIVTHYNGIAITSTCHLTETVDTFANDKSSNTTELRLLRNGEEKIFDNVKSGRLGIEIINAIRNPNSASAPK